VKVRVMRGTRTIFTSNSTLGQLFPGAVLNYRIPWRGRPAQGTYRVVGTIRPKDAATIHSNQTIKFTAAKATQLKRVSAPTTQVVSNGTPGWVPIALGIAALLVVALPTAVWKLARRPAKAVA
jgi:hypothetical protein